jgi:putative hydrolase of HD superfamily
LLAGSGANLQAHDIRTLHPFFTGSIPNIEHPTIRGWSETLMAERKALWASRGREEEEREGLRGMTVGCLVDAKQSEKPAQANGH